MYRGLLLPTVPVDDDFLLPVAAPHSDGSMATTATPPAKVAATLDKNLARVDADDDADDENDERWCDNAWAKLKHEVTNGKRILFFSFSLRLLWQQ